ncbi:7tm Chemosensory receptor [Popillia japonica]|uniref:Gustatory receptor n=1 Tax=Popillia japonica TaxID=7064 RepID=A0AAW1HFD9_POPJA
MNFHRAIRPLLILSSFFGFSVYFGENHHQSRLKRITIRGILGKLPALAGIMLEIWTFKGCMSKSVGLLNINRIVTTIIVIALFLCNLLFNGNKISEALVVLAYTDDVIRKNITSNHLTHATKRIKLKMALFTAAAIIFTIWHGSLANISMGIDFCVVSHVIEVIISMIMGCVLVTLLEEVRIRIQAVNDGIEGILKGHETLELARSRLIDCSNLHWRLCYVGRSIKRAFEMQILLKIIYAFFEIVFTLFYMIFTKKKTGFPKLLIYSVFLYHITVSFIQPAIILSSLLSVSKEANKTKDILHSHRPQKPSIDHVVSIVLQ